jgi:phosphopantothenoylcysteine synthetase/decarboxylase
MRENALSVIVCGSSAAVSLPEYLIWLRNEVDLDLRLLLTASAERFVNPQLLAWYADEVYLSGDERLNPAEFAQRSVGIVVLPATANMLAAAALGLAATPAQTVVLASERPVLFFPNMNASMWAKNSVKRHLTALRTEGHGVVDLKERAVFELSRRKVMMSPALPPPGEVTELIINWLENGCSFAESDEAASA